MNFISSAAKVHIKIIKGTSSMPSTLLTLYVAGHLIQYLLRVLKSLHQLSILALHYISQSVLAFLFVFVCVQQLFGDGVYKKFALVNEDDLN